MMNLGAALQPWIFAAALFALLLGSAAASRRRVVRTRVPARMDSIRLVIGMASELAKEAHLSDKSIYQCRLALDEACMNIIEHAYEFDPSGVIEVVIEAAGGSCKIELTDFGASYYPRHIPDPAVGKPIEETTPGGLGLYLMRRVMDEVRYVPGPRSNCLVMVKRE
jgi:serine/threonine-protein kinase RsbW